MSHFLSLRCGLGVAIVLGTSGIGKLRAARPPTQAATQDETPDCGEIVVQVVGDVPEELPIEPGSPFPLTVNVALFLPRSVFWSC